MKHHKNREQHLGHLGDGYERSVRGFATRETRLIILQPTLSMPTDADKHDTVNLVAVDTLKPQLSYNGLVGV